MFMVRYRRLLLSVSGLVVSMNRTRSGTGAPCLTRWPASVRSGINKYSHCHTDTKQSVGPYQRIQCKGANATTLSFETETQNLRRAVMAHMLTD